MTAKPISETEIIWSGSKIDMELVHSVASSLNVSTAVAKLLCSIDITKTEDAQNFLNPTLKLIHNPLILKDMDVAVSRILSAINNNERILIHSDYDADGVTTGAIFKRGFELLNVDVDVFCPNRFKEGYGLNPDKIKEFVEEYDLIISGDTGIRAFEAATLVTHHSDCDLIITDHHEPFILELSEETAGSKIALEQGAVVETFDDKKMFLPDCLAVIDPHRLGDEYPNKSMAGVGVAFKTMHAVFDALEKNPYDLFTHLDLVAVGSIADLAPQINKFNGKWDFENHLFCKLGIGIMNESPKPWVRSISLVTNIKHTEKSDLEYYNSVKEELSLLPEGDMSEEEKQTELNRIKFETFRQYLLSDPFFNDDEKIDSTAIGFRIGPTLNAPGRLDDPRPALDLLLEEDLNASLKQAIALKNINKKRQEQTEEYTQVIADLKSGNPMFYDYGIVVQSENFHSGIAGLVAGKLQQHFYRPTIALASFEENGVSYLKGSARSIDDVHILNCIDYVATKIEPFVYGGHPQAAGMTLRASQFDDFRKYFREACMRYDDEAFIPKIRYDTELEFSEINFDLIDVLSLFEPFGVGMFKSDTKEPLFRTNDATITQLKIHKNGRGASIKIKKDGYTFNCVTFDRGVEFQDIYFEQLENPDSFKIDLLYSPSINVWNNQTTIQLMLSDIKKSN